MIRFSSLTAASPAFGQVTRRYTSNSTVLRGTPNGESKPVDLFATGEPKFRIDTAVKNAYEAALKNPGGPEARKAAKKLREVLAAAAKEAQ